MSLTFLARRAAGSLPFRTKLGEKQRQTIPGLGRGDIDCRKFLGKELVVRSRTLFGVFECFSFGVFFFAGNVTI